MPLPSCLVENRKTAFTMVELLAAIAIIALLVAVMVPAIGNYVETARKTADKQTLTVLNDALTRYKTQGGDLAALTVGASIGRVLELLQTPVTWCGVGHQFLKTGTTYPARSLDAVGNRAQYKFYGYGSYSSMDESEIAYGTITSSAPYGKGVGYLERAGSSAGTITVWTSSNYVAYQVNGGSTSIAAATSGTWNNISVPAGGNVRFWSCAGAADSSYSGGVSYLYCYGNNLSSLDVSGLTALQTLSCFANNLSSLDVSHNTALQTLYCYINNLSSLDVSDNTALQHLSCRINNLSSLDVSHNTALQTLSCSTNNLSSLDVSHNTALQTLSCSTNNLSSLDVSGLTQLYYVGYYGNPFVASAGTLNAFYSSLEIPGPGDGGDGYLCENGTDPYSPVSVGQNMGLIPAGWQFSDY